MCINCLHLKIFKYKRGKAISFKYFPPINHRSMNRVYIHPNFGGSYTGSIICVIIIFKSHLLNLKGFDCTCIGFIVVGNFKI